MASLGMKEYSPSLKEFIKSSKPGDTVPKEVSDEIQGFLRNRPVVVLKNERAHVCYLRPGIQNDIQALFVKRGKPIDVPELPLLDKTVHDFSDLSNPPLCSKNHEDLEHLYRICDKVGLLRELYMEVISHDTDYFQQFPKLSPAPVVGFTPLGIGECACVSHKYNRVFTKTRYAFEQQFVNHILATVPHKADVVRVLSMGSGRLLQDWKLIGLLLKEGYNAIHWVLVDPINANNPRIDRVNNFFAKIEDVSVELIACNNISEVQEGLVSSAHAVLTVDFDPEIWKDLIRSKMYLAPSGKLFFGAGMTVFVVSAEGTTIPFHQLKYGAMAKDIEASVPNQYQGVVRIACIEDWSVAVHAITSLQKQGVVDIDLHIDMDADEEKITAHELFAFFFPRLKIAINTPTVEEIETQIQQKQQFDFILSYPLDEEEQSRIGVATFEEAALHTMSKTSTAYILGPSSLKVFRWK